MHRGVLTARSVAALVAALLLVPSLAAAQGPRVLAYTTFTADVAVTTTSETVVVSSPLVNTPRDEVEVVVIAWAQLTTGTMTTAVTPRIRRGTTTGGTLVGEANAEQVKAAAGSTEPFILHVAEQRAATSVQYSFTLQQTGANADGSALQGGIIVLAR